MSVWELKSQKWYHFVLLLSGSGKGPGRFFGANTDTDIREQENYDIQYIYEYFIFYKREAEVTLCILL